MHTKTILETPASGMPEELIKCLESGEIRWNQRDRTDNTLHVNVSVVDIRHVAGTQNLKLIEGFRILPDGSRHFRNDMVGTLDTKIRVHMRESAYAAITRGVREELGSVDPNFGDSRMFEISIDFREETSKPVPSASWPFFQEVFHRRIYRGRIIDKSLYKSEGYVGRKRNDHGKTTELHFKWIPVN